MTRPVHAVLHGRAGIAARHPQHLGVRWHRLLPRAALLALALALFVVGGGTLDLSWRRLFDGAGRLGDVVVHLWPPTPGGAARALQYAQALGESVAIAFLGTLVAALLAFPLAFLAAKNVVRNPFVHGVARRSLDSIRAIDTLIWALVWVSVVGLGPFAGILAIACADIGLFGKLFSEAIEATDRRAVEGVRSTGGSRLQSLRHGLVPQVLPVVASQVLYFFESNTRSATIIGIVGAGGIGLYLAELIRSMDWPAVAFVVLMILAAVAVIDQVSSRLRFALIGRRAAAA